MAAKKKGSENEGEKEVQMTFSQSQVDKKESTKEPKDSSKENKMSAEDKAVQSRSDAKKEDAKVELVNLGKSIVKDIKNGENPKI